MGRIFDWATDPSTPVWKPALAGLGTLAAIIGIVVAVLVLTHTSVSCPAGQSLQVITYIPVKAGSVTTLQPVYGCAS
jgi:hypothetical protein